MIFELIGAYSVGAIISSAVTFYHCSIPVKPVKINSSFDKDGNCYWLWKYFPNQRGFQCPKCLSVVGEKSQPILCSCIEYYNDHFHYVCNSCKYANIMRTADDSDN